MSNYLSVFFEQLSKLFKWWVVVLPWEQGLRIRLGKNKMRLHPGIYFRFPYFDTVVVKTTRMRMVPLSIQTVQTKDKHTLSLLSTCGYAVDDIDLLYQTLYHPEGTLASMVMSTTADFVAKNNLSDITPQTIEDFVKEEIEASKYGLSKFQSKVIGFAAVVTYRMISDSSWQPIDSDSHEKDSLR